MQTAPEDWKADTQPTRAIQAIPAPAQRTQPVTRPIDTLQKSRAAQPVTAEKITVWDRLNAVVLRLAVICIVGVLGVVGSLILSSENPAAEANRGVSQIDTATATQARQAELTALFSETNPKNEEFNLRAQQLLTTAAGVHSSAQEGMIKKFLVTMLKYESLRKSKAELTGLDTSGVADILGVDADAPLKTVAPIKSSDATLSSGFHVYGFWNGIPHSGQDWAAPEGTPVYATTDALVSSQIEESWTGQHVVIAHPDGSFSLYAHLSKTAVEPGQIVKAGDVLGYVGNTGRSFGAHLHFDHYPVGVAPGSLQNTVDPLAWLRKHGAEV